MPVSVEAGSLYIVAVLIDIPGTAFYILIRDSDLFSCAGFGTIEVTVRSRRSIAEILRIANIDGMSRFKGKTLSIRILYRERGS